MENMQIGERVARVEQKLIDTSEDSTEDKTDVKEILAHVNALDKRYYTRNEGRAVSAMLGLAVLGLTFWEQLKNLFK